MILQWEPTDHDLVDVAVVELENNWRVLVYRGSRYRIRPTRFVDPWVNRERHCHDLAEVIAILKEIASWPTEQPAPECWRDRQRVSNQAINRL
jgi:hypothetical protein